MNRARLGHQAVALLNGSILAIGGSSLPEEDGNFTESALLSSCEIYLNGTWYYSANLTYPRANFQVKAHKHQPWVLQQ